MRWKPIDGESLLEKCILAPLIVLTAPVWLLLAALLWLSEVKQRCFGPHADWTVWFAWHPVRTWNVEADPRERTVWLERVWRREYWGRVEYRIEAPSVIGDQQT